VDGGSSTFTVALWVVESDEKGTQCLGIIPSLPVPGGYTYRGLALQVGDWTQAWRPCSLKNLLLQNQNNWKPNGLIPRSGHVWQNVLRKAMVQIGLFCQCWRWFRIQVSQYSDYATCWTNEGRGFDSRQEQVIIRRHDRLWDPTSLQYNGGTATCFPRSKAASAIGWTLCQFTAKLKNRRHIPPLLHTSL
jgi:hypothetical protein